MVLIETVTVAWVTVHMYLWDSHYYSGDPIKCQEISNLYSLECRTF